MTGKKKLFLLVICLAVVGIVIGFFVNHQLKENRLIYTSHTFGVFYVEEKDFYIEPGDYMEMWVIGYNDAEEDLESREEFKVYIKDANVYNFIEIDQSYFLNISSLSEPGQERYYLNQIQTGNGEQLRGEGK
ncbi:hypothetical protein [Alkalihalophilus marmarensis]|uniref:Uncharacterized protein n=2 Tax=Alkalihalophilus TaxID=2893060 RepID=U6SIF8_9BACI|nr:hypothetical protein [Alkalihalophilus marmarensis]ERN51504.1 hypothetical protein A33I_20485 [Alkalihalophilus marmarensis DSM 21297]